MPTLAARNPFPHPTLLAVLVALLLALIPALAAAQPPVQIVVNANFEGGFSLVPNPDPLDGSSPDGIPVGWTRFETFSGGIEDSMLFQRTDNGPSRPGSNSLGISRVDGGTTGDWTAVRQDLDLQVNDCAALDLDIDVRVERQELAAGGVASPAFEWPILVQIDYTTTGGPPQIWRHGWYIDPPGDGNPDDAGSGLIPVFEDTLVPANHWIHSHFNLLDELPHALLVNRITVGGAGWDFEGAVDNVRIRCTPKALQLNARRFEVEAEWLTFQGTEGAGRPQQLTEDSGYFWFFDPDNIELQVKVLDACVPPFDRFWVFAAGLTNVEVTLRLTDTVANQTRVYRNELGEPFEAILDTDAFATCDQPTPVVCADFGPPFFAGHRGRRCSATPPPAGDLRLRRSRGLRELADQRQPEPDLRRRAGRRSVPPGRGGLQLHGGSGGPRHRDPGRTGDARPDRWPGTLPGRGVCLAVSWRKGG